VCPKRNSDIICICVLITDILKVQKGVAVYSELQLYEAMIRLLNKAALKSLGQDELIDTVIHDVEAILLRQQKVFKSDLNTLLGVSGNKFSRR
jgi:hypothetical protein